MITILYPVVKLAIGGAEQQLLELVRGLDKSRFRPIVAPLKPGGPLDGKFRAVPGVEVIDLNRRGKLDMTTLWGMARLLRARRVDIVQPFLTPAKFYGLLAAFLVGTPAKIGTERGGGHPYASLGNRIYRCIEDRLLRFSGMVIANSLAGRESLLRRGIPPQKARVIYNGLNPERLRVDRSNVAAHRARLGVPSDGWIVGMLASLTALKDHDTFLRAAALVSARRPEVRWALVGDGPRRAELEALAAELGLTERVVFFGHQLRVADLVAGWELMVLASRVNEGCSNAIVEAMALGVGVIATDLGGNRELIENGTTGHLVPAGDHAALAAAIDRALANSTHMHEIAKRAREMVNTRFSMQRMVSDYTSIYTGLVDRNPRVVLSMGNENGQRESHGISQKTTLR